MNILITGGTGFIGLATAEALHGEGHKTTLFGMSPIPKAFQKAKALVNATVVHGDIRSPSEVMRAIEICQPHAVLHLAAVTPDVEAEMENPAVVTDINIGGVATLMTALQKAALPPFRLVVASSVAVYGHVDPRSGLIDEDRTPLNPTGLYGITKVAAENVASRLAGLYGFDLRLARIGPSFGPWEYLSGVRPLLSHHGQILAHWNAGTSAVLDRPMPGDWLYSRDAGNALAALLISRRLRHPVYNVGPGRLETLSDWAMAFSRERPGTGIHLATPEYPATVAALKQDRAPLSIDRLLADTDYRPRWPIERSVPDHQVWLETVADEHNQQENQQ